jgi:Fe-Mn family superoxide dismutase
MQRIFKNIFFNRSFSKFTQKSFSEFQRKVELPKLTYNYEDLEPVLSRDQVETHHTKHHQAYVTNYNKLIEQLKEATEKQDLEKIVSLTPHIKFNGGSHINHSIYWTNLAPVKSEFPFKF